MLTPLALEFLRKTLEALGSLESPPRPEDVSYVRGRLGGFVKWQEEEQARADTRAKAGIVH